MRVSILNWNPIQTFHAKVFWLGKNHRTEDNARTERNAMELDCPSDVFFVLKRGFFLVFQLCAMDSEANIISSFFHWHLICSTSKKASELQVSESGQMVVECLFFYGWNHWQKRREFPWRKLVLHKRRKSWFSPLFGWKTKDFIFNLKKLFLFEGRHLQDYWLDTALWFNNEWCNYHRGV